MSSHPPIAVVALGGNAMQSPAGEDSVESDFLHTQRTARHLVALVAAGKWRVVITHGNGPQVGNHLFRSELGNVHGALPLLPLDVCVADTQGGMGYMLQQCLANALHEAGLPGVVASVVTQVVVDPGEAAFASPSKPVGEMIDASRVEDLRAQGWFLAEDRHRRGWRRVVASPDPQEIMEGEAIRTLVGAGVLVVAAGGGGIPVTVAEDGSLRGIPAVVDKDLASALLATDLGAEMLVIATDVEHVFEKYGTEKQQPIVEMSVSEARARLDAGEFPAGSMGPKVEALCRFVAATNKPGVISSIASCEAAMDGKTGTRVVP